MLSEASENKGLTSRSFWILGLIPMVEGWKGDVGDCNGPPENESSKWVKAPENRPKLPQETMENSNSNHFQLDHLSSPQIEDWLDYRLCKKNAFLGNPLNLGDPKPSTSEDQLIGETFERNSCRILGIQNHHQSNRPKIAFTGDREWVI